MASDPGAMFGVTGGGSSYGTGPGSMFGVTGAAPVVTAPTRRPKDDDHSILGTIGHVFTQSAVDLKDLALQTPHGLMQLHLAVAAADPSNPRHLGKSDTAGLEALAKGYATAIAEDIRHPLRHPGYTALDLLPFVSGGAGATVRIGQASRAARAGESATRALIRNPAKANERIIVTPTGATARGHYSRSGLGYVTQRATDTALQRAARRGGKSETFLNKRVNKWQERQFRVEQARLDANANKLWAAGRKLSPGESRALRFFAEKVPIDRRLAADAQRVSDARNRVGNVPGADRRTVRRLEERQQWGRDALPYLDIGEGGLASGFKATPEGQNLARIYSMMEEVVGGREEILKALDLMDEARLTGAKVKAGRFAAGAKYVEPTPAKLGRAPSVVAGERRVRGLEKRFHKRLENERPGYAVRERRRNRAEAEVYLEELTKARTTALDEIASALFGPIDKAEVARRNVENARARRQAAGVTRTGKRSGSSGRKSVVRPSVKEERRQLAAVKIDEIAQRNPDHPIVERWQEREAEIAKLEEAFNPDPEALFGEGPTPKPNYGAVEELSYKPRSGKTERLGGALSIAKEDLAKTRQAAKRFEEPTGVVGAEDLFQGGEVAIPESALFIGSPRQVKTFSRAPRASSTGTFGHTREMSLRESKGKTIEYGLDEPNVTKILAARGIAANRLKMLAQRIEVARKGGTKSPTRNDDVFLWNDGEVVSTAKIPPEVRHYLDDPEAFAHKPEDAKGVVDQARAAWMKWTDNWTLDPELEQTLQAATEGKGVFVQRSLLGDLGKPLPTRITGTKVAAVADATNNIQKALLIYLKANYPLIQGLSNTGMNIIQQGFAAPVNIARAGHLMRTNPELAAVIGDVMGTGAVMQASFEGTGRIARGTQQLAHWMSHWVDGPARLSAFRHEAEKAGFRTDAELRDLLENDANAGTLGEVAQRAKEAIVDYSEMSATERNFIRRMFFVYPWLKGSTKWTAHFLRDHPVQASVISQLAKSGQRESAAGMPLPAYLEGSFLSGPGGGLINPSGVNQFQTPTSIAQAIAGLATGSPTAPSGAQFLTPALGGTVGLLTGRNSLGLPLTGPLPAQLRQMFIEPTFAAQLARSIARTSGLTEGQQGRLADAIRASFGSRTTSKSFPNPNDPYWRFFLGGLYPRQYDEAALRRAKALQESNR